MKGKKCNLQDYPILSYPILSYDLVLSKTLYFSSVFFTFRLLSHLINLPPPFYRHPSYYPPKAINTFHEEIKNTVAK